MKWYKITRKFNRLWLEENVSNLESYYNINVGINLITFISDDGNFYKLPTNKIEMVFIPREGLNIGIIQLDELYILYRDISNLPTIGVMDEYRRQSLVNRTNSFNES